MLVLIRIRVSLDAERCVSDFSRYEGGMAGEPLSEAHGGSYGVFMCMLVVVAPICMDRAMCVSVFEGSSVGPIEVSVVS